MSVRSPVTATRWSRDILPQWSRQNMKHSPGVWSALSGSYRLFPGNSLFENDGVSVFTGVWSLLLRDVCNLLGYPINIENRPLSFLSFILAIFDNTMRKSDRFWTSKDLIFKEQPALWSWEWLISSLVYSLWHKMNSHFRFYFLTRHRACVNYTRTRTDTWGSNPFKKNHLSLGWVYKIRDFWS